MDRTAPLPPDPADGRPDPASPPPGPAFGSSPEAAESAPSPGGKSSPSPRSSPGHSLGEAQARAGQAPPPPGGWGVRRAGRPWGFWASLAWTVVWLGFFLGTGMVAFAFLLFPATFLGDYRTPQEAAQALSTSGLALGIVATVQAPVMLALTAFAAWLRMPVRAYLGLVWPGWRETIIGMLALGALMLVQDGATAALGRPIVPEFMVHTYRTAGFLPLLLVALLVVAPLVEETFFRGFLLKGLAESRAGPAVAVVLTSALWAVIHLQYDWFGMAAIFVAGLLLGTVRLRTGSTWLAVLLHALMNATATVQTVVVAEGWA